MTAEVDRFVQEMATLVEVTEEEKGEPLVDALHALHGPLQRREVTEAIQRLEAARHRIRLAMFALGRAQGTTASELGRELGFSRQLAASLATEASEAYG